MTQLPIDPEPRYTHSTYGETFDRVDLTTGTTHVLREVYEWAGTECVDSYVTTLDIV